MIESKYTIAIPPGATIKEQLDERRMSQKEFAIRMGLSEKHISRLINGEVQLTADVAVKLEMVLGLPAKFWNKLEANYREKIVKVNEENEMSEDMEILKKLPYNEMVKYGWIEKTIKEEEKVIYLRKYFEVVSLKLILNSKINKIACRKLSNTEKSDYALIAWVQKAKLEARNIETKSINLKKLKENLEIIRQMTLVSPEEFSPRLSSILSECGIALVFLPHISGSFLHGATFYDGKKIVMGLTIRGKDADKFWFSLFHELGHILNKHIEKIDGTDEKDENIADDFARQSLIDQEKYDNFIMKNNFSKDDIITFANSINIAPGIVIGRLQKEEIIGYNKYNELKVKYKLGA